MIVDKFVFCVYLQFERKILILRFDCETRSRGITIISHLKSKDSKYKSIFFTAQSRKKNYTDRRRRPLELSGLIFIWRSVLIFLMGVQSHFVQLNLLDLGRHWIWSPSFAIPLGLQ